MTTPLASARAALRHEGVGGLFRRTVRKMLRPVVQVDRWYFVEGDHSEPPPPPPPARVPLEIRIALPQDLEAHAEDLCRVDQDPAKVQARLARGDTAILGLVGGRLAHVQWLAFSSPIDIEEVGVRLFLGPREGYSYGVATLPEWRGYGIYPVVLFRRMEYERACNLLRHVAYVAASNRASLKTTTLLDGRRLKTVWTIRLSRKKRLVLCATRGWRPKLSSLPGTARCL